MIGEALRADQLGPRSLVHPDRGEVGAGWFVDLFLVVGLLFGIFGFDSNSESEGSKQSFY